MTYLTLSTILSLVLCCLPGHSARDLNPSPGATTPPAARVLNPGPARALVQTGRVTYRTYSNARFQYSVSYPAGIFVPQGEADNGDGQVFRARESSAEMRVFGRYNAQNETLRSAYQSAITGEGGSREVVYKLLKGNFYVVSGRQNGRIFYEKTILKGDTFKTLMIEYDESARDTFDPITARIARSFVG
ncbi:MAG TPA: hypothetical protein VF723_13055 [Pyrinomonadaceae bacterium]|jgi:hypothetical protein